MECLKNSLADAVASGAWTQEEADENIAQAEYTLELIRAGEWTTILPDNVMELDAVNISLYPYPRDGGEDTSTAPGTKPTSEEMGYRDATVEDWERLIALYKEWLLGELESGNVTQAEFEELLFSAEYTLATHQAGILASCKIKDEWFEDPSQTELFFPG